MVAGPTGFVDGKKFGPEALLLSGPIFLRLLFV